MQGYPVEAISTLKKVSVQPSTVAKLNIIKVNFKYLYKIGSSPNQDLCEESCFRGQVQLSGYSVMQDTHMLDSSA